MFYSGQLGRYLTIAGWNSLGSPTDFVYHWTSESGNQFVCTGSWTSEITMSGAFVNYAECVETHIEDWSSQHGELPPLRASLQG